MELALLVANKSGKVRSDTLHGRKYLVADVTAIVPGVLEGSDGPLLYPEDRVVANFGDWNGMPLIVYHSYDDQGNPISARSPDVLKQQGIGAVYNARGDGKLGMEAWFDELLTVEYDKRLPAQHKMMPKLHAGKPIDMSTGVFIAKSPAQPGAVYNGKTTDGQPYSRSYTHVVQGLKPDHLAVLPDQKGACSMEHGCGINPTTNTQTATPGLVKQFVDAVAHLLGKDVGDVTDVSVQDDPTGNSQSGCSYGDNGLCVNCGGPGGKPGPCPAGGTSRAGALARKADAASQATVSGGKGGDAGAKAREHSSKALAAKDKATAVRHHDEAATYHDMAASHERHRMSNESGARAHERAMRLHQEASAEHRGVAAPKSFLRRVAAKLGFNGNSEDPLAKAHTALTGNADMSFSEIRQEIQDALRERMTPKPSGDWNSCYIVDVYDTYFVYSMGGTDEYYKQAYSINDAGEAVLDGAPTTVERVTSYEPAEPTGNSQGDSTVTIKLTPEAKAAVVAGLVANCKCLASVPWKDKDAATLNALDDATLAAYKEWNDSLRASAPPPVAPPETQTHNQSRLTSDEQQDLAWARGERNRLKGDLVTRLTANLAAEARPARHAKLMEKSLEELRELAELIPATPTTNGGQAGAGGQQSLTDAAINRIASYYGAQPVTDNAQGGKEPALETLETPTLDFTEMAYNRNKKTA